MKSYDERVESIFKKLDERTSSAASDKKGRSIILRRSLLPTGLCAAVIGLVFLSGHLMKPPENLKTPDTVITETSSASSGTVPASTGHKFPEKTTSAVSCGTLSYTTVQTSSAATEAPGEPASAPEEHTEARPDTASTTENTRAAATSAKTSGTTPRTQSVTSTAAATVPRTTVSTAAKTFTQTSVEATEQTTVKTTSQEIEAPVTGDGGLGGGPSPVGPPFGEPPMMQEDPSVERVWYICTLGGTTYSYSHWVYSFSGESLGRCTVGGDDPNMTIWANANKLDGCDDQIYVNIPGLDGWYVYRIKPD